MSGAPKQPVIAIISINAPEILQCDWAPRAQWCWDIWISGAFCGVDSTHTLTQKHIKYVYIQIFKRRARAHVQTAHHSF